MQQAGAQQDGAQQDGAQPSSQQFFGAQQLGTQHLPPLSQQLLGAQQDGAQQLGSQHLSPLSQQLLGAQQDGAQPLSQQLAGAQQEGAQPLSQQSLGAQQLGSQQSSTQQSSTQQMCRWKCARHFRSRRPLNRPQPASALAKLMLEIARIAATQTNFFISNLLELFSEDNVANKNNDDWANPNRCESHALFFRHGKYGQTCLSISSTVSQNGCQNNPDAKLNRISHFQFRLFRL